MAEETKTQEELDKAHAQEVTSLKEQLEGLEFDYERSQKELKLWKAVAQRYFKLWKEKKTTINIDADTLVQISRRMKGLHKSFEALPTQKEVQD